MADSASRSERFGAFPSLAARLDDLDERVVLGGLGGLITPTFAGVMGDTHVLSLSDGVVGGVGTVVLPVVDEEDEGAARAFIISAFMGPIELLASEGTVLFDLSNEEVGSVVVERDHIITVLRYTGVWRVISDEGGSEGSGYKAAAILYTDSLEPAPGDIITALSYAPGAEAVDAVPEGEPFERLGVPAGWFQGEWWEFDTLNDEGLGEHVLVMLTGETSGQVTLYCEVTETGFRPIELLGGDMVSISCGGNVFGNAGVWVGRNEAPGIGQTNEFEPATFFAPIGMTDAEVFVWGGRFTGILNNIYGLYDSLDRVDALDADDIPFDPTGSTLSATTVGGALREAFPEV